MSISKWLRMQKKNHHHSHNYSNIEFNSFNNNVFVRAFMVFRNNLCLNTKSWFRLSSYLRLSLTKWKLNCFRKIIYSENEGERFREREAAIGSQHICLYIYYFNFWFWSFYRFVSACFHPFDFVEINLKILIIIIIVIHLVCK